MQDLTPRPSGVEKLVLQVVSGKARQQPTHPCCNVKGLPAPRNNDACVGSASFKPLSMESLEVNSVVSKENAARGGAEG